MMDHNEQAGLNEAHLEAFKVLNERVQAGGRFSTTQSALLAAHTSNALRSIALAIQDVADGKQPTKYIKEILQESDDIWKLSVEWRAPIDG
jgi:hypothetical protein